MPTRGMYQRVGLETTLPGSTVEYYKLNYEFSKYWTLIPSLVLRTGANIGYGDSYGSDSTRTIVNPDGSTACHRHRPAVLRELLRRRHPLGARLPRQHPGPALGSVVRLPRPAAGRLGADRRQVELIFPKLFDSKAARVSAFVDVGNVYDGWSNFDAGELRASAGVALLWRAPVGPISISYAYPFKKKDGDEIERLQFTFGGGF